MKIELIRKWSTIDIFDRNRVVGVIKISYEKNGVPRWAFLPTIENREYLIEQGVWKIVNEYSPKFKRKLWELKDVPNRTECKIHIGNRAAHSKGCICLRSREFSILHSILDMEKSYWISIINN